MNAVKSSKSLDKISGLWYHMYRSPNQTERRETVTDSSQNRTYIAIDLKSFYASVECIERGLDPMTTNLVVADMSRTEKTICLAVSPSLKQYGISGRARLFEAVQRVKEVNAQRRLALPAKRFAARARPGRWPVRWRAALFMKAWIWQRWRPSPIWCRCWKKTV